MSEILPPVVRTLTANVIEKTAEGYDFNGCDSRYASHCNCESWTPVHCSLCDQEIQDGQLIHTITMPTNPYFDMLSMDQEWEETTWHVNCDDHEGED